MSWNYFVYKFCIRCMLILLISLAASFIFAVFSYQYCLNLIQQQGSLLTYPTIFKVFPCIIRQAV